MKYIWKFFWFMIFLFVFPLISGLITGLTIFFVIADGYMGFGIGLTISIFIGFLCYRYYDKYRNKPYFNNQEKNLGARIDILFLISFISILIPLILNIVIYTLTGSYIFGSYALISYILTYPSVFVYNFNKPIDFFDPTEGKFKTGKDLKLSFKKLHNNLYIVNYIANILFLIVVFSFQFFYIFLLVLYIFFYIFTTIQTKNVRKSVSQAIQRKELFLNRLFEFKKKLVASLINLIFLVIIIAFLILFINMMSIETLIFGVAIIVACIVFYLKIRIYIYFHYGEILSHFGNLSSEESS